MTLPHFDAVVLAGGASRRMGGGDKTALAVGGTSLLNRVLRAVAGAAQIIVVGQERATDAEVRWVRENPPGGGPAAALAAGLDLVTAPLVVLLAADLPFLDATAGDRIVRHAAPAGAVLVDDAGKPQWLVGAWPARLLRAAFTGEQAGASLHRGLEPLQPRLLRSDAAPPEWFDIDEPADVTAARELLP